MTPEHVTPSGHRPAEPASAEPTDVATLVALVRDSAGDDLAQRIEFVAVLDRLRLVERRTYLGGGVRLEDSGSHSWHVATMAMALGPLLGDGVDLDRIIRMLLVHDIVEIDAGDVNVYDLEARRSKEPEEVLAADRIYGLLPDGTGSELRALWDEYEANQTPEARAAKAMDRIAPLLLNWLAGGRTWRELGVYADQVRPINLAPAQAVSPALADLVTAVIDDAVARGWLPERDEDKPHG